MVLPHQRDLPQNKLGANRLVGEKSPNPLKGAERKKSSALQKKKKVIKGDFMKWKMRKKYRIENVLLC